MIENQEPLYQKHNLISQEKIKAIELNLKNIERMSSRSYQSKTFCISLIGLLSTILLSKLAPLHHINYHWFYILLLNIFVIIFWYMDSKYLCLERAFVFKAHDILYVIDCPTGYFNFNPNLYIKHYHHRPEFKSCRSTLKTMFSWSICPIYIALIGVIIAITCVKAFF